MRAFDQIEHNFKLVEKINYDNKEGGRYAYVQMMAYTRELKNVLMQFYSSVKKEIKEIEEIHDQLNELVALSFSASHRHTFEMNREKLELISEKLKNRLSEEDKNLPVSVPTQLVA